KSLLYNDGYTIRGVQKVIKEVGTKKILRNEVENSSFTDNEINTSQNSNNDISQHHLGYSKRKKLMKVLNDLVDLRKKIDQDE
ncbi:hypothetical protein OBA27_02930, partial [Pelagibacteraceae bacterium]|nr:hypothetical protein [Pelagibacteraceae bacterium]